MRRAPAARRGSAGGASPQSSSISRSAETGSPALSRAAPAGPAASRPRGPALGPARTSSGPRIGSRDSCPGAESTPGKHAGTSAVCQSTVSGSRDLPAHEHTPQHPLQPSFQPILNIFIATALRPSGWPAVAAAKRRPAVDLSGAGGDLRRAEPAGAGHGRRRRARRAGGAPEAKITTKAPDWSVCLRLAVGQAGRRRRRADRPEGGVLAEIPRAIPIRAPTAGTATASVPASRRSGRVHARASFRGSIRRQSGRRQPADREAPRPGPIVSAAGDVWVLTAEGKRLTGRRGLEQAV